MGIVSDLHCNAQGLDLALQAMGDVDELLCLGDSIFEYRFSNDVVARLKQHRAHIIQGNHEEAVVHFTQAIVALDAESIPTPERRRTRVGFSCDAGAH